MKDRGRIDTGGGRDLDQNPFGKLDTGSYSPVKSAEPSAPSMQKENEARTPAGRRVDVRREKSGRGGKTVTVVDGLAFMNSAERDALAKRLRRELGAGGTVKGTVIELQGDRREKLLDRLRAEGFRPVLTGG